MKLDQFNNLISSYCSPSKSNVFIYNILSVDLKLGPFGNAVYFELSCFNLTLSSKSLEPIHESLMTDSLNLLEYIGLDVVHTVINCFKLIKTQIELLSSLKTN